MHVKYLAGIVGAALLMAGCSSSNELSAAGQSVRIVDEQPGAGGCGRFPGLSGDKT
ncbi:TPA: hypothetical protein ACI7H4_005172, partial [Escherichia coli]